MILLAVLLTCFSLTLGQLADKKVVLGIGIKLCSVKCIQSGLCMSFAYNIDRLACHLSHDDAGSWSIWETVTYPKNKDQFSAAACSLVNCKSNTRCVERRRGGAVCVEGHTVSSTLESGCLTNSDCPAARKFLCFTKTCKCVPGYSFNPANNRCVRLCKKYGNGFTTYQGMGIKYHNDRTERNKTEKECSEMCSSEKTFSCLTYERCHDPGVDVCHLSKSGYLDVPWFMREKGEECWMLAVRNFFITLLSGMLPQTSSSISLISLYVCGQLNLSGLYVLLCIAIQRISLMMKHNRLTRFMAKMGCAQTVSRYDSRDNASIPDATDVPLTETC
ncbi:uncharacterized protein [Haliotis cracherodii]|uniref:uncharacterized protein n=1 Tax=Haliotis cracherodii TaxID=6455 RepID=UPI0039E83AC7